MDSIPLLLQAEFEMLLRNRAIPIGLHSLKIIVELVTGFLASRYFVWMTLFGMSTILAYIVVTGHL